MRFQDLTARLNEAKGRLSKADAMLILREIETGRGGIARLAQKKPFITDISQEYLRRELGDPIALFRTLRVTDPKGLRTENIVSASTNWHVAFQLARDTPVYMASEEFIAPKVYMLRYTVPINRVLAYVPALVEHAVSALGPDAIKKHIHDRFGDPLPISTIIETGMEEEEVIADVSRIKPQAMQFGRTVTELGRLHLMPYLATGKSLADYLNRPGFTRQARPPTPEQMKPWRSLARQMQRFLAKPTQPSPEGSDLHESALSDLDMTSFDSFIASLRRLPPEELEKLNQMYRNAQDKYRRAGWLELYHGAPASKAEQIKSKGFALGKGERSLGFMGASYGVQNQGVFLTDSKASASYFGSNRSRYGSDYTVFTVWVKPGRIAEPAQLPRDVIRLGLRLTNEYEGTQKTRLAIRDWWWLLDRPEFVQAIKDLGYEGIRFREAPAIEKTVGERALTYMIFDPANIKIQGVDTIQNVQQFYRMLKDHGELAE